jgi:hypothetical protein
VVDGERPLKVHLYNSEFSSLESVPSEVPNPLPDSNVLKAYQRKRLSYFNPNPDKMAKLE